MKQEYLFETAAVEKLACLSKEDLITWVKGQEDIIEQLRKLNDKLLKEMGIQKEQVVAVQDQLLVLVNKFFGRSSERHPSAKLKAAHEGEQKKFPPKSRVQLPSLRYAQIPLIEQHVELKELPDCSCCGGKLSDSGLTEDSEQLSVIPKKFIVIRLKKHKYRCGSCHGEIVTVPTPPRIKNGSSYGDALMIDVAVAKYDYLLPVERYARMAKDLGVTALPPESLVETTHYVADKLEPIYEAIKTEVLAAEVLHADETPHRMLEGDKKKSWYLWGFSTNRSSYFELHSTRSGDVASTILSQAKCTYLVSDVYSGYKKAVTDANEYRAKNGQLLIENLYCNAHARRKFKESVDSFVVESEYFLDCYQKIYGTNLSRLEMMAVFTEMKMRALKLIMEVPEKSSLCKALSYFLRNFEGLTRCTKDENLPLDNNSQERQMRSPVVGRKTWYGTHSKRGAKTAALLFTIVESCKLNGLNSTEYIEAQIENLNYNRPFLTPAQYHSNPHTASATG